MKWLCNVTNATDGGQTMKLTFPRQTSSTNSLTMVTLQNRTENNRTEHNITGHYTLHNLTLHNKTQHNIALQFKGNV